MHVFSEQVFDCLVANKIVLLDWNDGVVLGLMVAVDRTQVAVVVGNRSVLEEYLSPHGTLVVAQVEESC